ncbi:hypothetical protein PR202_ga11143 [Eleusine coracana subsp. coracana]|uniref:VWFA domain-containing protein n=1 Tax=Eleusine coracana subsp. coracana TaxID=191504 RepID=A0AAV5C8C2_ELECO|nr:hypothetical protein PR202_ga11143 [Eleusine coracana subsp. coracana]
MITSADTVKVSTIPVYTSIPWEQQSDDFEVLVRVEAPASKRSTVVPIDLVAVLDVSDSMNAPVASMGDLSRLDLLKRAMKFIIRKLDDTDRLAIVAFNDQVVEEYSTNMMHISENRCKAKRKVDDLTAGGKTAFKPGLERAVKILEERGGDMANRAGFILLVSDGMERSDTIQWSRHETTTSGNKKSSSSRMVLLRKYPVQTFGLGAGHDPKTLHLIAHDSRGGTYSFVNDDNDGSSIAAALAVCLGGLKSVVAVDTRVKLTTAPGGVVRIRSVESGGYRSRVTGDGTQGEVVVDALYAGEVKSFVVRLRVPAVSDHDHLAGDRYYHHHHQQQLLVVSAVEAGGGSSSVVSIHRPPAQTVDWAASGPRPQTAPSPTVVNQIVRFELMKMVARFLREEEEEEEELLLASVDSLGRRLQSKWEEFKEAHKFWAGLDMAGLDREMGLLRRHGVAYVYSWASSHHMQRATTMGSPEKVVAEFLTAEMRALREEATREEEEAGVEEERVIAGRRRIIREERRRPSTSRGDGGGRCSCDGGDALERIDRRLEMWAKLKSDVPLLFQEDEEEDHRAAVLREASVNAINRAMHHDMYLVIVINHSPLLNRTEQILFLITANNYCY